jgi:indole-3-glycerol phosphate synthase
MTNTLAKICDDKREHIARCKLLVAQSDLQQRIKDLPRTKGFLRALKSKKDHGEFALIAEIKKASPSKGIIRADFDPVALAHAYVNGGAACISVLTDMPYFQGDDTYLEQVRTAVNIPLLRKDFMLDAYQVFEARMLGADCILLIMAALENTQAAELEALAFELGMDVLIEVHNEDELERAKAYLKSPLMGINNRDLKTLKVDIATTERLAGQLPAYAVGVCESGITSHGDLKQIEKSGIFCFLVGESLMRETDVAVATKRLLGRL